MNIADDGPARTGSQEPALAARAHTSGAEPDRRPFLGAYALVAGLAEEAAHRTYQALAELSIAGLELPLAAADASSPWWERHVAAHWDLVVTAIPTTMQRLARDARYGLASTDEEGRRAAMADVEVAARLSRELAQRSGRRRVRAVQVHSAPRAPWSSPQALARSLDELAAMDFADALITLEHCDAARAGRAAQKGFLELSEELAVLIGGPHRMTINWGRSAIEGRSPATALQHLEAVVRAGLLGGVMFSGVSDVDTAWGPAWEDAHLPPSGADPVLAASAPSLLGASEIARALNVAGQQMAYVGVKVCVPPEAVPPEQRVALARAALHLLKMEMEMTGAQSHC